MRKYITAVIFLLTGSGIVLSQTPEKKEEKYFHFIGLQANQLWKQIFNFNNTTTTDNPYLLVYSMNSPKTGWGLNAGLGYNYSEIKDKTDPDGRITRINDFSLRAGVSRIVHLGKRFVAGYGADLLMNFNKDKTATISSFDNSSEIDSTFSSSASVLNNYGGGLRVSLSYHITERVLIGTEATGYLVTSNDKQNVSQTNKIFFVFNNTTEIHVTNSNSETITNKFSITLPTVLFLSVRF